MNAFVAFGVMIFFMMSYPQSPGILAMFSLWWIALVLQRLGHFSRRMRGILLHGRFEGISWFETILPFLGPNVARVLEAATCGLLGASQSELDPGVAAYFTLGGVALFVKWIIDGHIDHLRVQRMNNAAIEHRATVARWHRGRSW
ncbi:hypothetical protein K2X85_18380 [bacterium]|nr:hypothetical protein [bacterium]